MLVDQVRGAPEPAAAAAALILRGGIMSVVKVLVYQLERRSETLKLLKHLHKVSAGFMNKKHKISIFTEADLTFLILTSLFYSTAEALYGFDSLLTIIKGHNEAVGFHSSFVLNPSRVKMWNIVFELVHLVFILTFLSVCVSFHLPSSSAAVLRSVFPGSIFLRLWFPQRSVAGGEYQQTEKGETRMCDVYRWNAVPLNSNAATINCERGTSSYQEIDSVLAEIVKVSEPIWGVSSPLFYTKIHGIVYLNIRWSV